MVQNIWLLLCWRQIMLVTILRSPIKCHQHRILVQLILMKEGFVMVECYCYVQMICSFLNWVFNLIKNIISKINLFGRTSLLRMNILVGRDILITRNLGLIFNFGPSWFCQEFWWSVRIKMGEDLLILTF